MGGWGYYNVNLLVLLTVERSKSINKIVGNYIFLQWWPSPDRIINLIIVFRILFSGLLSFLSSFPYPPVPYNILKTLIILSLRYDSAFPVTSGGS